MINSMKIIKFLSIIVLFFVAMVFEACNRNPKNDNSNDTVSSEGIDKPTVQNNKNDSTYHDTIVTPIDDNKVDKNNPDITK